MDDFERRLSASMKNAAEHPVDLGAPSVPHRWTKAGGIAAVLVAAVIVSVFVVTGGSSHKQDAPSASRSSSLLGTWRVTRLVNRDGQSVLRDQVALTFTGRSLSGTNGCNEFGGRYTQSGALDRVVRVKRVSGTQVGCDDTPIGSRLLDVRHVSGSGDVRRFYDGAGRFVAQLERGLQQALSCPARLAQGSEATHGFGPEQGAAEAPALPKPDFAIICIYAPIGRRTGDHGMVYTWRSTTPDAQPVSSTQLASLVSDLSQLAPPRRRPGFNICTAELGGRYLLLYRTGQRTVGVIVDGYGCNEVRLTSDPGVIVAGADSSLRAGVLYGPPSLIEDLRNFTDPGR